MKTVYLAFLMIFSVLLTYGQSTKSSNTTQSAPATKSDYILGTYVDKDQNGVCDNYENRGVKRQGRNFVDADGDGICDRRTEKGYGQCSRRGNAGQGCRRGSNSGFRGGRCK